MNEPSFKILIADDEKLAQDSIKVLLESVDSCHLVGTASNGQDALKMILTHQPDIVFIDIQMPHLLGTEVVEQLRNQNNTFFVFVTAFDDMAVKAFDLDAIDYLLKPYTDQRFYQSLNKAKNHIIANSSDIRFRPALPKTQSDRSKRYKTEFAIKSIGKIELVSVSDILFIKSSGNYVELFTRMDKYLMRGTINQIETELDGEIFTRIHRSTIIKKSEIKELQNYFNGEYLVIMKNDIELKLSRSYKSALQSIVNLD